jgi:hypothetical protein
MSIKIGISGLTQNFPSYSLELLCDTHLLLSRRGMREEIGSPLIKKHLHPELLSRFSSLKSGEKRNLLISPDHTRRSESSHSAVDTLLSLVDVHSDISLTMIFGLGSHPPMGQERIANLLGVDRVRALHERSIPILEQTTLQPMPSRSLDVAKPAWVGLGTLQLDWPANLRGSHLIVVTDNTELPSQTLESYYNAHQLLRGKDRQGVRDYADPIIIEHLP